MGLPATSQYIHVETPMAFATLKPVAPSRTVHATRTSTHSHTNSVVFFANISKSYAPTENLHESNLVENLISYRIVSHLLGAIFNNEGAREGARKQNSVRNSFETLYPKILHRYFKPEGIILKPYKNYTTCQVFRPIEPNLAFCQFF